MPLYRDDTTNVIVEYPENIGEHPVLGAHLSLYVPLDEEYEEDKVILENTHSTQRVQRTATPKDKD